MVDALWMKAGKMGSAVGTATIESDDNLFTIVDHGLGDADVVVVDTLTGGASGVLDIGTVYYVVDATDDDFALSLHLGGERVEFGSDGGADVYLFQPQYAASELRRAMSGMLWPDDSDGLRGREGVLIGVTPIAEISGLDWTVNPAVYVVDPGFSSTSAPYIVPVTESTGSLEAADGANDRIDALDLQIQDDTEDSSGFRRGHIVPVTGTPGGGEPSLTSNSHRIVLFDIPQEGTGSPSIRELGQNTTTRGGILIVSDSAAEPATTDMADGRMLYNVEEGAQKVDAGTSWEVVGSRRGYQFGGRLVFTADDTFDKGDFPGLRAIDAQVKGGGGGSGGIGAATSSDIAESGGGGSGGYCRKFIEASDLAASETITIGSGGSAGSSGNNDGGDGGTTTLTIDGSADLIALGGDGGEGMAASGGNATAFGGSAGSSSGGDLNIDGESGGAGRIIDGVGTSVRANRGGGGMLSGSALTGGVDSGGASGKEYGGGASGARNGFEDNANTGSAGANGVVVIDLYY